MNALPHFSRKWFQCRHSKIYTKLKNDLFKCSEHSFLTSRWLQNHFLRSFLWPNFDLNSFESFASLSQKMISTLSLKDLQKTENCSFQMLRILVFELKLPIKPFSKKLPITNSQKRDSTSSLKNLQKTEKWPFQMLRTFIFELKVASKPFSTKLPITKFWFK